MTWSRRRILQGIGAFLSLPGLPATASNRKDSGHLHFLGCRRGIDEATLAMFSQLQPQMAIVMDTYRNESEFVAKFLGKTPRYDVAIAFDDNIFHLARTALLSPLSRTLLPNIRQIHPRLLTSGNTSRDPFFNIPYIWGTLGIAYRKSVFRHLPRSWGILLDSGRFSGRIALLSDEIPLLQTAQKYLGYSCNVHEESIIGEAVHLLLRQRLHIHAFTNATPRLLLKGEVDLAMVWSFDFLHQLAGSGKFGYATPDEGCLAWQKALCIPRHADDPVTSHALINFLLDKTIAAKLAKKFRYATPNREAWSLLGEEYLENPALMPSEISMRQTEIRHFPDPEQARSYRAAWKRIQERPRPTTPAG